MAGDIKQKTVSGENEGKESDLPPIEETQKDFDGEDCSTNYIGRK